MVVTIGGLGIAAAVIQIYVWSWVQGAMLAATSVGWSAGTLYELHKVSRPKERRPVKTWVPGPRAGLIEGALWVLVLAWAGVNAARLLINTGNPLIVTGEAWIVLVALFHLLFLSICDLWRLEKGARPYLSD